MTPDQAKLLDWAREDARAARLLADEGLARQAVSRAYYAMFCAARALLLTDDREFSKHSAVIAAFGKQFARTERVPRRLHRYLIDTQDDRLGADYRIGQETTAEDAAEALRRAKEFIEAAEEFLGATGSDD